MLTLTLAAYLSNLRLAVDHSSIAPAGASSAAVCLVWLFMGVVFSVEAGGKPSDAGLCGERGVKQWYPLLFLGKLLAFSLLFQAGLALSAMTSAVYAVLALEGAYLVAVLAARPYASVLHQLGAIACSLAGLSALCLAVLWQFSSLSEEGEFLCVIILEALIVVAELMTLVRLGQVFCDLLRSDPSALSAQAN
jgi:hypothetical protein